MQKHVTYRIYLALPPAHRIVGAADVLALRIVGDSIRLSNGGFHILYYTCLLSPIAATRIPYECTLPLFRMQGGPYYSKGPSNYRGQPDHPGSEISPLSYLLYRISIHSCS